MRKTTLVIRLHFKHMEILKFHSLAHRVALDLDRHMESKDTPKKLYRKQTDSKVIPRCRLCNSVSDPHRCKNLFKEQNRLILRNAEVIYGGDLIRHDGLSYLVCAPCERRVNNAIQFKKVIVETQRVLRDEVTTKRCVELSPSIKKTAKARAVGSSRRRSIDFTDRAASESQAKEQDVNPTPVSIFIVYNYNFIIMNAQINGSILFMSNYHLMVILWLCLLVSLLQFTNET